MPQEIQPAVPVLPPITNETRGIPLGLLPYFDRIVSLTDAVCAEHLDEEYVLLCRRLTAALCRKRPPPVTSGRIETWACGITYTIGSENGLFSRREAPTMTSSELSGLFGLSASTGAAKCAEIRRIMKIGEFEERWVRPSKLEDHHEISFHRAVQILRKLSKAPYEVQQAALHNLKRS